MGVDQLKRFAVLGNHLPRHCGIATFTTHLTDALVGQLPGADAFVIAMNDVGHQHAYPGRVRFEIGEGDLSSYRRAADFLNVNQVDVLSVQHEYGIFGGKAGVHLLEILTHLRMPIVTTLHTVLSEPNAAQRLVLDELAKLSERLVVMSESGAELLRTVHNIPDDQIDLIPHGIPVVPETGDSKRRLGVEGKTVIMTFGLLSPDKGIEYVVEALPAILAVNPDTVYIVLGATHPHVVAREGEAYRLMLEARARQLGVDGNMIFHNRFVSQEELTEFLSAADIYITPYLNPEQITSGTLAYAIGAGKAVISTPYIYAREILADGRGLLVPWKDSDAIASTVIGVMGDTDRTQAMCRQARAYGRTMTWPAVARRYVESFSRALTSETSRRRSSFRSQTLASRPAGWPEIDLRHVRAMTDDTGILQHAVFNVPRYDDGYCLDDNARALLLMTLIEEAGSHDPLVVRALAARYLAFVNYAFDRSTGRFRNFLSYGRQWLEAAGSEDSHGRALWALGAVVGRASDPGRYSLASELFHAARPAITAFTSPRAWAYSLLGIDQYLRAFEGDSAVESLRAEMSNRLLALFERSSRKEWPWFEDSVTYCNARMSQALIVSGSRMNQADMVEAGVHSLEWLVSVQLSSDREFAPIGSNGFFPRGGSAAVFDQQPVEACTIVSACLDASRASHDAGWMAHAARAFDWFLGRNDLQQWLYDPSTGGCRDGLHADRTNRNQGAESTLSFLLALCEMRAVQQPEVESVPTLQATS
ncbi:MAG TPA: glycosyltransferase family 4 protein [Vicinamibacterales bacterium]|nr:glycosyltransferase family 4 protein [Vicinamibacterales bacterium]